MDLSRAKQLKPGDRVHYPEDRGVPAGTGKVVGVGTNVCEHMGNKENQYVWVDVQHAAHRSIWPSNRLG